MQAALQRIWEENKKFLLMVGGSLALFLLLRSCAVDGLLRSADAERQRNQKLEKEINGTRSRVIVRYPEEKKSLADLAQIESNLAGRCLSAPPSNVPDTKRSAAQIQFSEMIDAVWSKLKTKANQKGVRIPEKISTNDLGVAAGDTEADHERNAMYLEIVDRALATCVDQGMVQIEKPTIFGEEAAPIRDNEDVSMLYRRVGVTAYGPYEAYKRVFREFQKAPGFVQVRLMSLDSKSTAIPGALRGQLQFVGLRLLKEGEDASPGEKKKPASRRKKPR